MWPKINYQRWQEGEAIEVFKITSSHSLWIQMTFWGYHWQPAASLKKLSSKKYKSTVLCLIAQLCPTLFNPMDCSPPLSVGILQVKTTKWVAMSSSRGSSRPRDRTQVSHIAGGLILYRLSHQVSPSILEWVAFSRGTFLPRKSITCAHWESAPSSGPLSTQPLNPSELTPPHHNGPSSPFQLESITFSPHMNIQI